MKLVGYVDAKFQADHCGHTTLSFTLACLTGGQNRVYNAVFYLPLALGSDAGRLFAFRGCEGTKVEVEYEGAGPEIPLVPRLQSGHP